MSAHTVLSELTIKVYPSLFVIQILMSVWLELTPVIKPVPIPLEVSHVAVHQAIRSRKIALVVKVKDTCSL